MHPTAYTDSIKIARLSRRNLSCIGCHKQINVKHKFFVQGKTGNGWWCTCIPCSSNEIDRTIQRLKEIKELVKQDLDTNINLYTLTSLLK